MSSFIPIGSLGLSRRLVILIAATYLLTCFCQQALLADELSIVKHLANQDHQYDFAQTLLAKGHFIKAAGEFDRFVFFFPNDPRAHKARYQAAQAYFKGARYEDAVIACKTVIEKKPDAMATAPFYLLLARTRIKQEDFNQALITLHNFLSIYKDPAIRDEARYLGAWIFIQTAQWPKALTWLKAISDQNREAYSVEPLTERLADINTIPQKRPRLAGFLAVVPGLGHLYSGRYQDALTAFVLNGLTIWSSYEAFEDDHPGLGSLLGLVSLNLYVGNIYSAVNSAHQFNRRANERFIRSLTPFTNFRLSMAPGSRGAMVMMTLDF